MSAPLLQIDGLCAALARQPQTPLLRAVSLAIQPGEVHGLVGESGAGKSTIGKTILDILPPAIRVTAGHIAFNGEDLLAMPENRRQQILGSEISLIPQDPMTALNPARRIGDQLGDGLKLKRGMRGRALHDKLVSLLTDVQINDPEGVLKRYPHELSGGMRQRVLIAAAFSLDPKLIIADEPTTALDVTVQKEVLRLIRNLQRSHGTGVLFVTHDLGVVAQVCDRLSVLFAGMVVEQGETAPILANPSHRYTKALLEASPHPERADSGMTPIPSALIASVRAEVETFGSGLRQTGRALHG